MTSVAVERGHLFTTAGDTPLGLDLYRSPHADAPLVLYVHGGGWRSGDRADAGTERLLPLAAYGVTVASVDYRLVPGATFPDQVHDLKGAVRWLRAYGTSLGVRTDRLGIWGASAGAYLGSLLALTARRCRIAALRWVLSTLDYPSKDPEVVGTPDPLIVGPPDQVYEQSERSWSRRRNGLPVNPTAGRPELWLDKTDDDER